MLVWIHAASDNRWGDGRRRVPSECLRTAYVCEELRHAGFEDLSAMEGWRGCVCGLALMQPRADPSSATDLLTRLRDQRLDVGDAFLQPPTRKR